MKRTIKDIFDKATNTKPLNLNKKVKINIHSDGDNIEIAFSFSKEYLRKIYEGKDEA